MLYAVFLIIYGIYWYINLLFNHINRGVLRLMVFIRWVVFSREFLFFAIAVAIFTTNFMGNERAVLPLSFKI